MFARIRKINNLRLVLLLQVVLPVVALVGLLLAIALEWMGSFAEQRLQRDLQLVARAIRLPVSEALIRSDFNQLQSSLASVFEISEVYGAYLFGPQGQRLVSLGSVNPGREQSDLALTLDDEFSQYERISGRNVFSYFLPLFDTTGQPSGLLQVTRLRSDIEAELNQLKTRAWLGFLAIALLLLGLLMLAHQYAIGRPLNRLMDSIRRVEAGNLDHRALPAGPGELRHLGQALNSMLDAIQSAEHQVEAEYQAKMEMEKKLKLSEKMALLGQLSAGVAHELGAPLSVVDGRARRLARDSEDPAAQEELESIRKQVSRMTALIEQLLAFGRDSRQSHHQVSVDVLFQQLQEQVTTEGGHAHFLEGPRGLSLKGDAFSLEQALINLLRNAWQACPQGEVHCGWLLPPDRPGWLRCYVEDAGPGISPNIGQDLFEPFVTTKVPGKGSGMGLAIVQRVVREHGGEIRVSEGELGGARFEIDLRLQDPGTGMENRQQEEAP